MFSGLTYLVCKFHRTLVCPGRGVIRRNGLFHLTAQHTHAPDERILNEVSFRNELFNSVTSQAMTPRNIYDQLSAFHENAALGVPFESVHGAMLRWREANLPPQPTSMQMFCEILESDNGSVLLRYHENRHLSIRIVAHSPNAIIIADLDFVRSVFSNEMDFYIDVSTKAIPSSQFCEQLISFLAVKNGFAIPCPWALTQDISRESYYNILQELRFFVPELTMKSVITSYSDNFESVVRQIFPGVNVYGSLLDYNKEICKMITLFNLDQMFFANDENEVKKYLTEILYLPFLPPEAITPYFESIRNNLSDEALEATLLLYVTFEREWIEGVTPKRFSIYRCLPRISNIFELYASRLLVLMGSYPTAWEFVKEIVKLQNESYVDFIKIQNNVTRDVKARRVYNRLTDTALKRAWDNLEGNNISQEEYLNICRNRFTESGIEFLTAFLNDSSSTNRGQIQLINADYAAVYAYGGDVQVNDEDSDTSEDSNLTVSNETASNTSVGCYQKAPFLCMWDKKTLK
ncbi:uncharacterized protein LOC122506255 isoform X1 [Leptopilina heterotoma]|uniref:uncharacterized protein LOC122506255 isoform X1 n=1 Tax=Leptopilina heterotoma TaxID=63436 RepID=UPI001CA8F8C6|nr:uncharacterized protein LOC122506255 isoform X1 [Leptopilina heterotoma]